MKTNKKAKRSAKAGSQQHMFRLVGEAAKVPILQAELARARKTHAGEIKELREGHAKELEYARVEIARLQVEVDRLRLMVVGGNQTSPMFDPTAPRKSQEEGLKELRRVVDETFLGTPWQRLQAERKKAVEAEDRRKIAAQSQAAALSGAPQQKENTHGSSG